MQSKPDRSKINPFKHQQYLRGSQEKLDKLANSLYPKQMNTSAAEHRLRVLEFWDKHGTEATRDAFAVGRTTLYRWKSTYRQSDKLLQSLSPTTRARRTNHQRRVDYRVLAEVIRLRTCYPRLGKEKLCPLLAGFCQRERIAEPLSESRVGRILGDLKRAGRLPTRTKLRLSARSGLLVEKQATRKPKLRRKSYVPKQPGDLVQIDTVVSFIGQVRRYTVTAIDVTSRFAFAWSYPSGSSASARDFFRRFELVAPFRVSHVQTDNGSEFMEHFREYLEEAGVAHFFNYPRRPQWNGTVERFNRTIQEEFLSHRQETLAYDLEVLNGLCCDWLAWYNGERYHHALKAPPLGHLIQHHGLSQIAWTHTPICCLDKWDHHIQLFFLGGAALPGRRFVTTVAFVASPFNG